METKWKTYEEVATYLLNQFANHFGVGKFEGKQVIPGNSGTEWEIDAKGCSDHDGTFLVVERKRHTKSGICQATVGSLAWSIYETGASGGILVSPLGLQAGAIKVADNANIVKVVLDENSTTTDYLMTFLNQICVGFSDTCSMSIKEELEITVLDEAGNTIDQRKI